jgi:hypothetical protein
MIDIRTSAHSAIHSMATIGPPVATVAFETWPSTWIGAP